LRRVQRSFYQEKIMLERLTATASFHTQIGMLVVVTTFIAMVLVGWETWRGTAVSKKARISIIVAQLALMFQALIGVKLLDQGAGVLQLYVHYLGGLAPLGFFLAASWWPMENKRLQARILTAATIGAFLFSFMSFTIGRAYVRGDVGQQLLQLLSLS
jgi:hypothetical protein